MHAAARDIRTAAAEAVRERAPVQGRTPTDVQWRVPVRHLRRQARGLRREAPCEEIVKPIHSHDFVERVLIVMLGVLLTCAVIGIATHCGPEPQVAAARAAMARQDTVFVHDTVRLAAASQRARATTDAQLDKLPPTIKPPAGSDVPADSAICWRLAAFDAWRAGLRAAITSERDSVNAEIVVRNARIASLRDTLTARTRQWEVALVRGKPPRYVVALVQQITPRFQTLITVTARVARVGPFTINAGIAGAP